jgi:uncharacterized iron-regulated protein
MTRLRVAIIVTAVAVLTPTLAGQGYVPNRVYDTALGAFTDFETMATSLTAADVVLVGEQHDDPNTHRLELAVLEGLARRKRAVIVSMEMFERDVQEPLDHFQMGHMAEDEFLKASRPWPRYATDYKPLVDFAIARNWPVVAANVPRPIASEVSKGGVAVLASKTGDDLRLFARDLACPSSGPYFTRFVEAMGSHPAAGAAADEAARTAERYYQSQCLKDETMAESIAQALTVAATTSPAMVVHFNGAFHSDYSQGTAERVKRRLPGKRVVVISIVPKETLDGLSPDADMKRRADFVIYTIAK